MSECERFDDLMEDYLAGEITPADLEALESHARSCLKCGKLMELHSELSSADRPLSLATVEEFKEMRAEVRVRIEEERRSRAGERHRRRWGFLPMPAPAYVFAFAVAFVALGFFLGRTGTGPREFSDAMLIEEIMRQASMDRGLEGYWDSPFTYSNVTVRPQNGRVLLSFDASRHIDVNTTLDSPLSREVLVYAMIEPAPMGSRLEAMTAAGNSMDTNLKEAMVFILLNDPSLPVRLRSLDILSRYASDPVVQDALLTSLAQDPSVQVRLLALESLAREKVAPDVIRNAIGDAPDESGRAVLHRAIELIGES